MSGTRGASNDVLAVNAGSSSVKFALFSAGPRPERLLSGKIERIGTAEASLVATRAGGDPIRVPAPPAGRGDPGGWLADWIGDQPEARDLAAVGHRVVHGGVRLFESQRVTGELLDELRRNVPLDRSHLPAEIALIEAFGKRFPDAPQIVSFDTLFHRDLPRVAQILPIPRVYTDSAVRRLGFHGLSYAYLMEELRRTAGDAAADGRVILAHLGSGASLAAVRNGRPMDTSMAFTPTAGLVMGTRPGDLDPGLLVHIAREEGLDADGLETLVDARCGLAGISGGIADMRDLERSSDPRAAEAIAVFCYQAAKWIGAFAAVLGGIDTLVFSGGIGERSPEVRRRICSGLSFLGLEIDGGRNDLHAAVISSERSRVTIRVVPTDEEIMIARETLRILETP